MKKLLAILVCAFALSSCGSSKKEVQPPADKQGATKARLTELFQLCKDDRKAEAAPYIDKEVLIRGTSETEALDEICGAIKTNLSQSERHEFKEFHIDSPETVTWIVAFHRPAYSSRAVYTFTFRDGKYVLAVEPDYSPLYPIPGDSQTKQQDKSSNSTATGPSSTTIPILNDKATRLPQPAYPALARSAGAAGEVRVAVTVDENGNVIQASAVTGHPLLRGPAVAAARSAKFEPTKIDGRPVQVKGILRYEFVAP